jgi:hypothetical protein
MQRLFIGGVHDGKWVDVDDGCYTYKVPVPIQPAVLDDETADVSFEYHIYTKRMIPFNGSYYEYLSYDKLNPNNIMRTLFNGYRNLPRRENDRPG